MAAKQADKHAETVAGHFSKDAGRFDATYRKGANRQERLRVWRAAFDRYLAGARLVYDLGCGSGILTCELARRGIAAVGFDGAEGMLAIARERAAGERLDNLSFIQRMLPIAGEPDLPPADAIVASSVFEYMESMDEALKSSRALLKPGGMLLFSVSNHESISRGAVRLVHRLCGHPAYIGLLKHFMTEAEIRAALRRAGFDYLAHGYFEGSDRFNRALSRLFSPRFASNMILAVACRG